MLFVIRLSYKMELGSHLGGHDSNTVFLATKRDSCPSPCLRLVVKKQWNN